MDRSFGKSFGKAQQLHSISLNSFIASISLSAVLFSVEVLVFLIVRKHFPDLYTTVPEQLDGAPTHWKRYIATNLLRFDRRHEHFDRYFFRQYLRSLLLIFTPASLLITPILVPLNYTNGKTAILGNELTFYVATQQHSPYAALCTVLIDSIPDDWMSEQVLRSQLEVFPGEVTAISFNRDYSAISQLSARRERLARALEVAEISNIRKAYRAGVQKRAKSSRFLKERRRSSFRSRSLLNLFAWLRPKKVDINLFYQEELRNAGEKIELYRKTREDFPLLRSAFVTFANPLAAHIACQTVIHTRSGYMTPRTIPLSVDNVVWSNVNIALRDRTIRTVLSNVLIMATATAYVVPVALAGLLSQIIYITQAVSWLSWINELPASFLGLLQGVVPPILVTVLVKGFISILDYLVRKQGISSRSQIDVKIQDYYFYFLFVQVTLVVSLSAGLTAIANEMASGASLAVTLAKNLPKASNYFISYILLQALSVSANSLLRMDRLFGKLLLSPIFDKSVTQIITRRKGQDIQWGTFVPVFTNLSCIGRF
ncbi:RSN1 7TM multi-domain protein [Pyrenophora teres f. teres]|uniref:RSN1 7TM multi-domain protein n=1 Tax=Pyrenophora teres f. teres TaxID=97479 RepID=A0A6S6WHF9_9PLEO|nr:RSN1 7TM multi-domain protein [Pyrenophora teres f. teres]